MLLRASEKAADEPSVVALPLQNVHCRLEARKDGVLSQDLYACTLQWGRRGAGRLRFLAAVKRLFYGMCDGQPLERSQHGVDQRLVLLHLRSCPWKMRAWRVFASGQHGHDATTKRSKPKNRCAMYTIFALG